MRIFQSSFGAVVAAMMLLVSQPAAAGFINFESDAMGFVGNGFTSASDPGVHFFDTVNAELQILSHQAIGTRALAVNWDDASQLRMTFDSTVNSLSLIFGNDDPEYASASARAWLELFDGATSVGLVSVQVNLNDLSDQSIAFSGANFNSAVFWYGDAAGAAIDLIEVVDNIAFDNVPTRDVPEPGSLTLLGLGFAGLAAMRRKQKTA
ncbi:PEP-CTERM sorting domain-containing protein [Pseudoduganella sp. OTU4001]|uniref:PEP-CTERM sorting domain-containing protein n=1 Tax=Pseudoduganella sp. OTU4001 TaxID=3043854 RepID=UPI00313E9C6E